METKKYTSYAEIEHDLEILKLEKRPIKQVNSRRGVDYSGQR